jgi:type IX secretion system PorP/SprF family membrane protein
MNIKKVYIILLILLIGSNLRSQDPQFSQFYANPLYLNPAFTGSNICPRMVLNYRNQWPSIPGTFVTYNASYDQYFDAISGGLGLMVTADNQGQGIISTTTLNALYAYSTDLTSNLSLKAGFEASYFWEKLDFNKLTFGDQIDPRYGFVYNTNEKPPDNNLKNSIDFSAGLLLYSEKFFCGFAANHVTQPNIGFYSQSPLPIKYTFHIGGVFPLEGGGNGLARNENGPTISPNLLYQRQQDFQQVNVGLYVNKFPFVGGLWYRQSVGEKAYPDAAIILLGLETGMMRFGYSYDITISKLTLASGGAHEISFALRFGCPPQKKKIRVINCPTF